MTNFKKRFFTSTSLLFLIYLAFVNSYIMFLLLFLISYFSLMEFFNLYKRIFKMNKKKVFFLVLLTIFYFKICMTQIYLILNSDVEFIKIIIIFLLFICISSDIGGYIFGNIFKGKKISKISPNKTYSGVIGAFAFSLITFFYFYIYYNFSIYLISLTLIASFTSQIGDFFISFLKRKANLKDTGNLLPGHGGILDRIDGIVFALPICINLFILF